MIFYFLCLLTYYNFIKKNNYIYIKIKKMLKEGIEPSTLGLLDPRSNQLSYPSFVDIYNIYYIIFFFNYQYLIYKML
jgi:hypothetical protein